MVFRIISQSPKRNKIPSLINAVWFFGLFSDLCQDVDIYLMNGYAMHALAGISVRRFDIFVSTQVLPLASGFMLPAGTPFVCKRGGEDGELVFQHPGHGGLSMVTVSKTRIASFMERGVRHDLPIRLAVAFGYPIDHISPTRPFTGRWYELRVPMVSRDGSILPVGTRLSYQRMNGLHVFTMQQVSGEGHPKRLVLGEEDLRGLAPCSAPRHTPHCFQAEAA